MEPVGTESAFAAGFCEWRAVQPSQHRHEDWLNFWSRVNRLLGYDHSKTLGNREDQRIDDKLSALGWVRMLKEAGFASIDVLLRDSEKIVIASLKP